MYLLKVRVDQHRCSLAVASKRCPIRAEIISYILLNDEDALFLVRTADSENVTEYIKEVERHKNTKFIQVLEKTPIEASFVAVVSDTTGIKAFESSYCFIKPPILVEDGSKIYEIIVPSTSYLPKAYANLDKVGSWKILEIKNIGERKAGLTEAQKKVLKVAYDLGYFSERRDVTISDIAMALGIAKSTAHKHLKIAISKLVEKYIQEKELEKSLLI
ncbi:helix-turn-helix domain-containing protein [Archaeoglobus neptunius]|uniref:helix-turn-helix domain-containing protein n=1 Tax=Archaeoglobus neptunius TaxID=2798580 RepID=UPI0019288E18|nr:helix-turn-helix domain-containing protein [Archaeoglobus neptunius]